MKRILMSAVLVAGCIDAGAEVPAESGEDTSELDVVTEAIAQAGSLHGALVPQLGTLGREAYRALARSWMRWALAQPWSSGPISDQTGAHCGDGQSGLVWFLAGTGGGEVTRSCTIPAHTPLFFPLENVFIVPPPEYVDTPEEVAELVAFAEAYFPERRASTCNLVLRVDGRELVPRAADLDPATWVEILSPFSLTMNDDNFTGEPGGFRPAVLTGGHHALLTPLAKGKHTVELGGSVCGSDPPSFTTRATYHLDVK